jgi:hypothetical protein
MVSSGVPDGAAGAHDTMRRMAHAPPHQAATRHTLHRIAAHVLGRRRHQMTGRFGLRACPGGFATPAFGDGPEALRVTDGTLVRDVGDRTDSVTVSGSTLRTLVAFAGADLEREFSSGTDTPELGDVDEPLRVEAADAGVLADWFTLGARTLDLVVSGLPAASEPAVVQLWPEHFDLGTNVGLPSGERVNLGASPGDGGIDEPYLYVGPWGSERPGDPTFWNAPFGAVRRASELGGRQDGVDAGVDFVRRGLDRLAGAAI